MDICYNIFASLLKKHLFLFGLCLLAFKVSGHIEGAYYTDSYKDCTDLRQLFEYTYLFDSKTNAISKPYDDKIYEVVTCNYPGVCPDGISRSVCSWQRYLEVSCVDMGTHVNFYVATNSLPNHCYYITDSLYPIGDQYSLNTYAFGGIFNAPPSKMNAYNLYDNNQFTFTKVKTQTDIDTILCEPEWARSTAIDGYINYKEGTSVVPPSQLSDLTSWQVSQATTPKLRLLTSNQVVGVSLNGVFFYAGTSEYGYDAFFPKAYGNRLKPRAILPDVCLGSITTSYTYRYHMYSPCIYDIVLREVSSPCSSTDYPLCKQDVREHAIKLTPNLAQTLTPIGIAKDGRIIYGPFKTDGTLWQPCDVDVCNGRWFNNHYGYVATMFHPYLVGCWGPGNQINLTQSCSNNAFSCLDQSLAFDQFQRINIAGITMLTLLINYFM